MTSNDILNIAVVSSTTLLVLVTVGPLIAIIYAGSAMIYLQLGRVIEVLKEREGKAQ